MALVKCIKIKVPIWCFYVKGKIYFVKEKCLTKTPLYAKIRLTYHRVIFLCAKRCP